MMNFGYAPFGAIGWVFMILWWVIVVIGAIALIRWLVNQTSSKSGGGAKTPLQILQERYAKGEIEKKEFDEKKQALV